LTRFGRVGLYLAEDLELGLAADPGVGPYAAARKVVFAVVAIGIGLPALLLPALVKERSNGPDSVGSVVAQGLTLLIGLFLPAALGLMLIAPKGLPAIFGAGYDGSGVMPLLVALRMPILLVAVWFQTVAVALGHERQALRVMGIVGAVAVVVLPAVASLWGSVGIAGGILGLEILAALGGWQAVRSCGIRLSSHLALGPVLAGSLAMTLAVLAVRSGPLVATILTGVGVYSGVWWLTLRLNPAGKLAKVAT
jgi:O-antigen/teichoic acid export membrane protein